jgi:hypothetical protein
MYPTKTLVLDQAGNQVINHIHNLIVTIGSPTIRKLARSDIAWMSRQTLESALNPETNLFQMVTVDGDAKLIIRDDFTCLAMNSGHMAYPGSVPTYPLSTLPKSKS